MVNQLLPFMSEVLERVQPFTKVISHIHLKEDADGHIVMSAPSSDGSVNLFSRSAQPIGGLGEAKACLGNLQYLTTLLRSSLISNESSVELVSTEGRNGKLVVRSFVFRPHAGMEMVYVASDPFRDSVVRAASVNINDWPVLFEMSELVSGQFSELKRIHSTMPSDGKEDVLSMTFDSGSIVMVMGSGNQTSTFEMDVEVHAEKSSKIALHLPSDSLFQGLRLAQARGSIPVIQMADKALRIMSETPMAEHTLTLIRRKIRTST